MDREMALRLKRAAMFHMVMFGLWSVFRTSSMAVPFLDRGRDSWQNIAARNHL